MQNERNYPNSWQRTGPLGRTLLHPCLLGEKGLLLRFFDLMQKVRQRSKIDDPA
jgi:hypothetical protein